MNDVQVSLPRIIAPPPLLYIGVFMVACAVHAIFPQPIMASGFSVRLAGAIMLVASGVFARWAFITMRQFGTSASPRKASLALSTSGPFAFSRNPIYLAMTGLYVGATALLNSWWPMLLLVPLLLLMHWGVVLREERYLLAQFGDAYASYKAAVRRWL